MDNPGTIERRLIRLERLFALNTAGTLLLGVPLSLAAPLLIATLFWRAYLPFGPYLSWWWFFAGATLIVIPSLYRLECRTEGHYFSQAAADFRRSPGIAPTFASVGLLATALSNPRAVIAGLVDIFLMGPRLVVGGWKQTRVRWMCRGVSRGRAAEILKELATAGGVPPDRLLKPDESEGELARTLAYLVFFDCIGVAHDGGKVWLLSQARTSLELQSAAGPAAQSSAPG